MGFTPLWGYQAAALLAGRRLCADCALTDAGSSSPGFKGGGITVDVNGGGAAHAGDLVTGMTACGLDANHWTWVIPTAPTPTPAIEQP